MKTRGLYEVKRHFQRDCHFRADQRFREKYCPGIVRGRDGRVLYGWKLRAEREIYMELDVADSDFKRPFYYDVLDEKNSTFTTEDSRVRIQINLLMTFLRSGVQLWALEDYWTKWVLQLDILQRLRISIGVQHTFLLVILDFPQTFFISVVFLSHGQFMGILSVFCLSFLFCLGMRRTLCPCLTVVLFQTLLHHCFIYLLQHIAVVLEREKV